MVLMAKKKPTKKLTAKRPPKLQSLRKKKQGNPTPSTPAPDVAKSKGTIVWGEHIERSHYLKVPKVLCWLARYNEQVGGKSGPIYPRHILLLLTLAACKYKNTPTRLYWQELGDHLGISWETARKWAYQLEAIGLLKIKRYKKKTTDSKRRVGFRNERNTFDISPFVAKVDEAHAEWKRRREERAERKDGEDDDE